MSAGSEVQSGARTSRRFLSLLLAVLLISDIARAEPSSENAEEASPPPEGITRQSTPELPADADERRPWRAHEALGTPWLWFELEHRSRFEHLENDFRTANAGNATGLSMRTLLRAELRFQQFFVGAELQDSRIWASETALLDTTHVNPLELLEGYVGFRGESVLARGDAASLRAGRMTIDLGSRRLVARNEFRNTINAFTGLDLQWTSRDEDVLRGIAVTPIVRAPSDPEGLEKNRIEFDRENPNAFFWGAFYQSRPLAAQVTIEAYLLGLHESDGRTAPSSDRKLYTPGMRTLRQPAPGEFDFQLEFMSQFGSSRASREDTIDLDHLAFALHGSSGFLFDAPWAPRLAFQYDYASGDRSPDDGTNNRFDTLFGARRFEYGPTGLYGAIARSNVSTPGLRLEVQPHRTVDAFTAYRLVWLASAQDAWTTAELRDPTGDSGSFVGRQVEGRVRWHLLPRNFSLDVGGALFVRGDFARQAPGGAEQPSIYSYVQVTGNI